MKKVRHDETKESSPETDCFGMPSTISMFQQTKGIPHNGESPEYGSSLILLFVFNTPLSVSSIFKRKFNGRRGVFNSTPDLHLDKTSNFKSTGISSHKVQMIK
ncbi:hypothetical protein [Terrimonas alba]|uniref:hypothetical protein n=1 Tax=Terrimonas alba TaxID=3349636 RepID=UPI0035F42F1E